MESWGIVFKPRSSSITHSFSQQALKEHTAVSSAVLGPGGKTVGGSVLMQSPFSWGSQERKSAIRDSTQGGRAESSCSVHK